MSQQRWRLFFLPLSFPIFVRLRLLFIRLFHALSSVINGGWGTCYLAQPTDRLYTV
jgi:hypothetical protein